MPIYDVDIYQAANLLIRRYGPQAHREAIQRAGDMLMRGDIDGHVVWTRICRAVVDLQVTPSRCALNSDLRGDPEGQRVWLRIKRAIVALQAPARGPPH